MTLSAPEITSGLLDELDRFQTLLGTLDAEGWATATRCEGWTVADCAAHVVGSMVDVAAGRLEGLGSPEVTAREVAERRGRSPGELADELAQARKQVAELAALFDEAAWQSPSPGGYDGTLAQGVEALFYDTWAHADDIRAALGRPSVGGDGLRAGLHHAAGLLAKQGWGPAVLALDGVEEIPIGSGGPTIAGDPLAFMLVASGRQDPSTLGLDSTVNIYR